MIAPLPLPAHGNGEALPGPLGIQPPDLVSGGGEIGDHVLYVGRVEIEMIAMKVDDRLV